jgi:hypothetical protein
MGFSYRTILAICATGLVTLACDEAMAQNEIFQCTDPSSGKIEYKNTGETKGCKRMTVEPVVMPKLGSNPGSNPTSGNFPKVDPSVQKARDSDRHKILDDELAAKKTHLAELQKDYNNGEPDRTGDERNYQRYLDRVQQMKDNIARTQSDIDSIQGEIGKLPQ